MRINRLHIIYRSIFYYKKQLFYQFLIIALLAAIIAGSLLTGSSVRSTLKQNTERKLNNTGFVISSGLRYLKPGIEKRLEKELKVEASAILELNGFCSNFNSEEKAEVQIYGVSNDFFELNPALSATQFNGSQAILNTNLAERLRISVGDDIIVKFESISDIPLNAPFSPDTDPSESLILTVSAIADESFADFSLNISQLKPSNIFIPLSEFKDAFKGEVKVNRILLANQPEIADEKINSAIKSNLTLEDIGLKLRSANHESEIISDRVFIDKEIVEDLSRIIPNSSPLITYLVNNIQFKDKSTPYSFVSALPAEFYVQSPDRNRIIVNEWLANDLAVKENDTIVLTYYQSDSKNKFSEKSSSFVVSHIVKMDGIWADEKLMPEFPGISGTESCSNWNAGIAIDFKLIREKDEAYWNQYKGTPKAFINYADGIEIWGNQFGPATALRIQSTDIEQIKSEIYGKLNPSVFGISLRDAYQDGMEAATNSVDFSTLFISLSFFIILSAVLLLSLILFTYLDGRKKQLRTLFSLGFKNRAIQLLFLYESGLISFLGALAGVFSGIFINQIIISALNSVWEGAVQTNTLAAFLDWKMLFLAFFITFLISMIVVFIKVRNFLKHLHTTESYTLKSNNKWFNSLYYSSLVVSTLIFVAGFFFSWQSTLLFFLGGSMLFISTLLFYKWHILQSSNRRKETVFSLKKYSWYYYLANVNKAINPILFIAAGLFIILITAANRKDFNVDKLSNQSGSGGFMFWVESAIPIHENLNDISDRKKMGFEEKSIEDLKFLQLLKLHGDDASCLNLNQISAPSILGVDNTDLIENQLFSFAQSLKNLNMANPWEALSIPAKENIIYGIADQTVLQWGLKLKIGDTLSLVAENGQNLLIILAGGLKPSVFQGSVLIGKENFHKFMPSIAGSKLLLLRGDLNKRENYRNELMAVMGNYGISIENTEDRLAAFYEVTNTYLDVFMTLGGLGMLLGIFGLSLVLLKNMESRKNEFAFLMASGYTINRLRKIIYNEFVIILIAGIFAGTLPGIMATLPSLRSGADIPWLILTIIVISLLVSGILIIKISVNRLINTDLIAAIQKE